MRNASVDETFRYTVSRRFRHTTQVMRDAFVDEMRLLSRLRHPCITTVMGAVMDSKHEPLLIMERMDHGSLHDLAMNHTIPFDGDVIVPMVRHVAQGLSFLHSCNPPMVHGDLKAANVLVDSQFRAKIADFGLSTKGFFSSKKGAQGTPYWMSPEILNGSASSVASDIFAFGITFWEVYSRLDPYDGEDFHEVLAAVKDVQRTEEKRPVIPVGCPPEMAMLMKACWHNDITCRPQAHEIDRTLKALDASKMGVVSIRKKTDANVVLQDIFPKHIADKLLLGEKVEPEHRDRVTIFFSDIVSFTDIAQRIEPQKVSDMLDRLYTNFDNLSQKYDIFKVETIGDAYMAVTNLVKDQHDDHALRIARFAQEAIACARGTLIDVEDPSLGHLEIRVGFHSGPVVANVVGKRNPRYCLFGDTVNTSSRMESNSLPGKVHCSHEAAEDLRRQLALQPSGGAAIELHSRGTIPIKGKGYMRTFWVNAAVAPSTQEQAGADSRARDGEMSLDPGVSRVAARGHDTHELGLEAESVETIVDA